MFTIHMPDHRGLRGVLRRVDREGPADNLKEVRPTMFFGVPRIWEKFHAGVAAKLGEVARA